MKTVLLRYDVSNDLISCPDRIVNGFSEVICGIYEWIKNDPEALKYKLFCEETGDIGYWINTETVLKYINSKCLNAGEKKARLIKENVSRKMKADVICDF